MLGLVLFLKSACTFGFNLQSATSCPWQYCEKMEQVNRRCCVVLLLVLVPFFSFGFGAAATTLAVTPVSNTTTKPTTAPTNTTTRPTAAPTNTTTRQTAAPTNASTTTPTNASTTTPNKPTTVPATTVPPVPQPKAGNWTVRGANGTICMQMSFAVQMNISYNTTDKKKAKVVINMDPKTAELTSDCTNSSSNRSLTIYPFGTGKVEKKWTILLTFKRQSDKYSMIKVGSSWVYDSRFPDSGKSGQFQSESVGRDNFLKQQVALGNYYICSEPLSVQTGQATVRLFDMKLQPFAEETGGKFGEAEECSSGLSLKYIIIIAVGGGLLLLVVLIAVCCIVRKVVKKKKYGSLQNE